MIRAVSPAPAGATVDLAGLLAFGAGWARAAMTLQLAGSSFSTGFVEPRGKLLAALGGHPMPAEIAGESLIALWFIINPFAGRHLLPMLRLARLTLEPVRKTEGLRLRTYVRSGEGGRLARWIGLQPAGEDDGLERWEWTGGRIHPVDPDRHRHGQGPPAGKTAEGRG